MAGAMVAGIARYLENVPVTIVVEPDSAACVWKVLKQVKLKRLISKRKFDGWNVLWRSIISSMGNSKKFSQVLY